MWATKGISKLGLQQNIECLHELQKKGEPEANYTHHNYVSYNAWSLGKFFASLLPQRIEIHAHSGQEIFRLPNVHPETLQLHAIQLLVGRHVGEHLLLDARGLYLKKNPIDYNDMCLLQVHLTSIRSRMPTEKM